MLILTAAATFTCYAVLLRPRDRYWVFVDLTQRPWFNATTALVLLVAILTLVAWLIVSDKKPQAFLTLLLVLPVTVVVLATVSLLQLFNWLPVDYGNGVDIGVLLLTATCIVMVVVAICALIAVPINRRAVRTGAAKRAVSAPNHTVVGYTLAGEPLYASSRATSPQTNTMSILALCFGVMGGILGIPFGHIALNQIRRTGEQGRGLAIAGLALGYLSLVLIIVWLIFLSMYLDSVGSL